MPIDLSPLPAIARAAISESLGVEYPVPEAGFAEHGASFVTLTQSGELRGCIGTLAAYRPLAVDIRENAVAAALRDPRFEPLSAEELAWTRIEVSVLSPASLLSFENEADLLGQLRPGIDGVVLEYGFRRSTFLPQVWENLPHPADFMKFLKQKAGLPGHFWSDEIRLSRYSVSKVQEPIDGK